MTHLSFTDAEFFNAKNQGIRLLRQLHTRFPKLTYDFTTRVDHVLEHEAICGWASSTPSCGPGWKTLVSSTSMSGRPGRVVPERVRVVGR